MEPAGAWGPCQIQLANWTFEEEPAASSLPMEYASIDIPCTFGLQAYVPQSCVSQHQQQQMVEYYEGAMQHDPTEKGEEQEESFQVALHRMEMEIHHYTYPFLVLQEVVRDFEDGIGKIGMKMHRYPPNIRDLGDWCTVPRIVAIGPYHHGRQQLKEVEQVKHVAAYHCILESDNSSLPEVYGAVISAAHDARRLYNKDVMAGIGDRDFLPMMFFDACFLVQYMLWHTKRGEMAPSLRRWFHLNRKVLRNDVMLLENQLPWGVVQAVMRFRHASLTGFVSSLRDILQNRKEQREFKFDDRYKPPHLLGLLRHHVVGSRNINTEEPDDGKIEVLSLSVSAIELAKIGIKLRANETPYAFNMGLNKKGMFFAELSLWPLSLTQARAIRLVSMAAFELCTAHSKQEDSAVCSYLHFLSMLVHREEDVQELRTRGILQGAGLTNKEALDFFKCFQSVPHGSYSAIVMVEIERYKVDSRIRTKVYAFLYKNKKAIFTVSSTIVAVVGIFGTLITILLNLKSLKASP